MVSEFFFQKGFFFKNAFFGSIIKRGLVVMKSRTTICMLAMLVVAGLFTSCLELDRGPEIIAGKGAVVSADFDISEFENIFSSIGANINIHQAEHPRVTVSMQENLFKYLSVKNEEENLTISFGNRTIQSAELVVIDVYTPHIKKFYLTGAGVMLSELPVEEIFVSGSGGFRFKGQTESVLINISGIAEIDFYEMPVNKAEIRIIGSANVRVNVAQTLNVFISGAGNVYYKGSPTVTKTITGFGNVEQVD